MSESELQQWITLYPALDVIEESVLLIHTYSPRLRYPTGDILSRSDVVAVAPNFEEIVSTIQSLL